MKPTNQALHERRQAATMRGVGVMTQIFADRASNAELWDVEGNRYIDFAGGIAVLNTGHRHPKVMAAAAPRRTGSPTPASWSSRTSRISR